MGEWQKIETAPTDGTEFLAAVEVHDQQGNWWWERNVISIDDETGDVPTSDPHGWTLEDYSHWMPLPEPPND